MDAAMQIFFSCNNLCRKETGPVLQDKGRKLHTLLGPDAGLDKRDSNSRRQNSLNIILEYFDYSQGFQDFEIREYHC